MSQQRVNSDMSKVEVDTKVGDLIAPVQDEKNKQDNTNIRTDDFAPGAETKSATYEQSAYCERLRVYSDDKEVSFSDFSDSAFGSSVKQTFEGASRAGETGNVGVCNTLIARLNQGVASGSVERLQAGLKERKSCWPLMQRKPQVKF